MTDSLCIVDDMKLNIVARKWLCVALDFFTSSGTINHATVICESSNNECDSKPSLKQCCGIQLSSCNLIMH
jgi:hypothetical protein